MKRFLMISTACLTLVVCSAAAEAGRYHCHRAHYYARPVAYARPVVVHRPVVVYRPVVAYRHPVVVHRPVAYRHHYGYGGPRRAYYRSGVSIGIGIGF